MSTMLPIEVALERIHQKCLEFKYTFIGFKEDYRGVRTKLILYCTKHGIQWGTTDVNHLHARSKYSCPDCNKEFNISRFKKEWVGRKSGNLEVIGEEGKKLIVTCSVCSKDKELFPQPLKILKHSFNKGCVPCGCSKSPSKTKEQYAILCQRKADTLDGLTFIGFRDQDVRYSTKVILNCSRHGMWDTSRVEGFLRKTNNNCPKCTEELDTFGFYSHKSMDTDTLYILMFKNKINPIDTFIKIGRTFNIKRRLNSFPKDYKITELALIEDSHKNIHKLEQQLHTKYKEFSVHPQILFGGSTECFTISIIKDSTFQEYIKSEEI